MSDNVLPSTGRPRLPARTTEELFNSLSHGLAALLAVAGLVILVVMGAIRGDAWYVVSYAVFGASAILLYSMSTVYHAARAPGVKRVLEVLDHSSIYALIAGSYTPYALTVLRPTVGWWVFGVVWGAAALGIALKPFLMGRSKLFGMLAYVAMGWIIVFAWKPLKAVVDTRTIVFLAAGGLSYTAGTIFYMMKSKRWAHPVWHLFVGAGTVLHFFAALSLLPA